MKTPHEAFTVLICSSFFGVFCGGGVGLFGFSSLKKLSQERISGNRQNSEHQILFEGTVRIHYIRVEIKLLQFF